jgi:hypothetical protein
VDPYPSVKIFFATGYRNECKQLFQAQVALAVMDRRTHIASTYHYIKELIAPTIIGYDLINENLIMWMKQANNGSTRRLGTI